MFHGNLGLKLKNELAFTILRCYFLGFCKRQKFCNYSSKGDPLFRIVLKGEIGQNNICVCYFCKYTLFPEIKKLVMAELHKEF